MRDNRKYLLLVGVIVAALVGALLVAVPGSPAYQKPVLGLDLQGGLEVVLQAKAPKGHTLTSDDLDRSVSIMQNRLNKFGVSEPEIRKQGSNQIVIQLAGVHDPAAAAALIGKTAQLQFYDFETDLTGPSKVNGNPVATPGLYDLLKQVQDRAPNAEPESYYLFKKKIVEKTTKAAKKGEKPTKTSTTTWTTKGNANTREQLLKPYGGKVPAGYEVLKVPANTAVVSCPASQGCIGAQAASPSGTYYYLFNYFPNGKNGPPELSGKDLQSSDIRADIDPNTGQ